MKISELMKALRKIKAEHGDLEMVIMDPEYGDDNPIISVELSYPTGDFGMDRSKPPIGVRLDTY